MQLSENGGGPGASPAGDESDALKLERGDDVGDAFPQHEECVAILTMKCGEPLMAVRKKLHDEIPITFIPEEGFGVFQSKVERHYSKLGPIYAQEKRAIYLKPSSNATQSKYVQLTKENFEPLLRVRWKVARSMKVELKYEVFCYFVDITTKKEKKRLSMKMFQQQQQQQQQQGQLLPDSPSSAMGGTGTADVMANGMNAPFMNFGQASTGFPLAPHGMGLPNYSDLGSALMGDSMATGKKNKGSRGDDSERARKVARGPRGDVIDVTDDAQQQTPVFHTIPFRINGFVVPLEVDITALRRSLGLLQTPPVVADTTAPPAVTTPASELDPTAAAPSAPQYDR